MIPTLNEQEAIGPLIEEIKSEGFEEIVVVDGYSRDDTAAIASKLGARVIMQHGKGKAGALLSAFQEVSTPYLLVIDGDGTYNPSDFDKFLPLMDNFDFVKGVREWNDNMPRIHKFGNRVITKSFDVLFGTSIGDVCSGMYMIQTDLAKSLLMERHPFAAEQEIVASIVQSSASMTTIPISYRKRRGGVSKVNTWRQGIRDLITNFDLARTRNPVMFFSGIATMALVPSAVLLLSASWSYLAFGQYHSGYFLAGLVLLVLGAQGVTIASLAAMLRRIERRLSLLKST